MTVRPQRLLLVLVLALVALAAVPSLAAALTITVDDNRSECPLADYTSLPAAVAAAANGDTIHICAGTYNVPGGPAPSSGLKIEKNLHIEGAGASKVFVQPTPESGSMAQATPNPRDEYGNVITVRRRLIELYEVTISGLTVRTGTTAGAIPAEAGIAMIDVDTGKISGVKVEGIVPSTGPGTGAYAPPEPLSTQGQGIIVANTIEATDNVTTIEGSEVKGFNATGVLVDNRLLGGSASVGNESHVTAKIVNTKITGAGGTPAVAQTGVEGWGSGARVQITDSKISGVGKADGSAAAVALHGVDLAHSFVGGAPGDAVNLTGDAYGATNVAYDGSAAALPLEATNDYWGTTVTGETPLVGANVDYAPVAVAAPTEPTLAPVVDTPPTLQWDDSPGEGGEIVTGVPLHLAAVAADDYGVKQVLFKVSGAAVGVAPTPALTGERLYQVTWTPSSSLSGAALPLTAVATDSAGQVTETTLHVNVKGPPRLATGSGAISGAVGGIALVGEPLTCGATDASYPAAALTYAWTSGGTPVGTSATYTPTPADQGKRLLCTVTATNAYGSTSVAGGTVEVAFLPAFAEGATIVGPTGAYALAGEALTCKAKATGEPTPTLGWTWQRDGVAITGAAAETYIATAADSGHQLTCAVTASSSDGAVVSSATVAVGGAPTGGTVTLTGDAAVGSTLSCASAGWTAVPEATLSYAWLRDGTAIAGATGTGYTTTGDDAGKSVACQVTATNELGSATATSAGIAIPALVGTPPPGGSKPGGSKPKGGAPKAPSVGKVKGIIRVKAGEAKVATVTCPRACSVSIGKSVTIKIGGKVYAAKGIAPAYLKPGDSAPVYLQLGKAARAALAHAMKPVPVTVPVVFIVKGKIKTIKVTVTLS